MRNRTSFFSLSTVTALASAFLLGGCAVMRIDVDVYKGPLANDEIVQLQQFQSMAPGMFEVMVQLRDQFEWGELPVWQCEDGRAQMRRPGESRFGKTTIEFADCPPGYKRRAMDSNQVFTHPKAVQVNAILKLFEDKKVSEATRLSAAIDEAIRKYRSALNVFDPRESDYRRWKHLERAMRSTEDFLKSVGKDPVKDREVGEAYELFKSRFRRLLDPLNAPCRTKSGTCNWRSVNFYLRDRNVHEGIAEAYTALQECLSENAIEHPAVEKSDNVRFQEIISPIPPRHRTVFSEDLAGQEVKHFPNSDFHSARWIDRYADILYGTKYPGKLQSFAKNQDKKKLFIAAVSDIARSYFEARSAMRELWELGVRGLSRHSEFGGTRLQKQQIRDALAELVSTVTNPRRLAIATLTQDANDDARKEVLQILHPWPSTVFLDSRYDYEIATDRLKKALKESPNRNAISIRALDSALISSFDIHKLNTEQLSRFVPTQMPPALQFEYQDKASRKFGVTRGLSADIHVIIETALPDLSADLTNAAGSGGLANGRPEKGIFSLIDDVIRERQRYRRCRGQLCEARAKQDSNIARDELSQGLIHFAQKVSAIANHDTLLPEPENEGIIPITSISGVGPRVRKAFVPALQAIGNTFLIQADELEARARHEKKLEERRIPGELARAFSLSGNSRETFDNLLLDLNNRVSQLEEQVTKFAEAEQNEAAVLEAIEESISDLTKLQGENTSAREEAQRKLNASNATATPAVFAFRTLTGNAEYVTDSFVTPEQLITIIRDQNAINKHLGGLAKEISIDEVKQHIVIWLEGDAARGIVSQINPSHAASPRHHRLTETRAFFKNRSSHIAGSGKLARDKAVTSVITSLTQDYLDAVALVQGAEAVVFDATVRERNSTNQLESAQTTQKKQLAKQKNRTSEDNDLDARLKRIKDTISVAMASRNEVVANAEKLGVDKEPSAVFALLKQLVNNQAAKAKVAAEQTEPQLTDDERKLKEAERKKLEHAAKTLAAYQLPTGQAQVTSLPDRMNDGDQRDVLDDLIAALHYSDIEAERSGQAARAKSVQAALKKAYEYRASMVYIRPASAYLRSSYASSTYQDDPGLGWRNMLDRHGTRALPFRIGEAFSNLDTRTLEIQSELDKQFWQNINSVRVGGGGITNYALIKDDIGNWAIKSYSANPEPIIKAAQSLAMFNLGGSLDTNLLRVNELRANPNRSAGEQEELNLLTERTTGGGPALKRLFEHHEQRYVEKTDMQLQSFAAAVKDTTLQKRVQDAWTQSLQGGDDEAFRQSLLTLPDNDDAIKEANKTLTEAGSLPALSAGDDVNDLKKKRQEREKAAVKMGKNMVTALGHVNSYRSKLLSEAGLIIEKKVKENRGQMTAASTTIKSIEKSIAEQETTEKNLMAALADLRALTPDDTDPQRASFDAKIAELEGKLTVLGTELAANKEKLALEQSALATAKAQFALREIQLQKISADANRIVGGVILEVTRGRQAAMAAFEQAILFIGDAPDASGDPLLRVGQQQ
ncbi:hypothetical protein [Denitrobaculum tricleocarpae]|uniref:Uncharacterized protein n=1 Tax=Denitrobaculum tricleocarpae TaxID=2591009 RepID=A0A545TYL3_9PROT|nr:hypothetical protein [Denitrobaculum tricleocarpae]TQV82322.1 hypothetical protein FKG95_08900 [Denitrobaculum tricleocarpae]